jgi:hypothetical protein
VTGRSRRKPARWTPRAGPWRPARADCMHGRDAEGWQAVEQGHAKHRAGIGSPRRGLLGTDELTRGRRCSRGRIPVRYIHVQGGQDYIRPELRVRTLASAKSARMACLFMVSVIYRECHSPKWPRDGGEWYPPPRDRRPRRPHEARTDPIHTRDSCAHLFFLRPRRRGPLQPRIAEAAWPRSSASRRMTASLRILCGAGL